MKPSGVLVVEDPPAQPPHTRSAPIAAFEHIANRPIAHHVLDALADAGIDQIIVVSSDGRAAQVRECLASWNARCAIPLRYLTCRDRPLDVAAALALAAPEVGSAPCVVHVADGLLGTPIASLLDHIGDGQPNVTVIRRQDQSDRKDGASAPLDRGMLHLTLLEPEHAFTGMAGVWLFGAGALRQTAGAGAAGGSLDAAALNERLAASGGNVRAMFVDRWSQYAGDPLDLLELNRIALDRLHGDGRTFNHGNRIEGRVEIHERASVSSSVIVGPAVIGPTARIADAYIGPYTSIGPGARVEGAEIERSIIGAGASVMHIGGRLMASVVGRDARIFRDFSLPRAVRLRVGDGTVVGLC